MQEVQAEYFPETVVQGGVLVFTKEFGRLCIVGLGMPLGIGVLGIYWKRYGVASIFAAVDMGGRPIAQNNNADGITDCGF